MNVRLTQTAWLEFETKISILQNDLQRDNVEHGRSLTVSFIPSLQEEKKKKKEKKRVPQSDWLCNDFL